MAWISLYPLSITVPGHGGCPLLPPEGWGCFSPPNSLQRDEWWPPSTAEQPPSPPGQQVPEVGGRCPLQRQAGQVDSGINQQEESGDDPRDGVELPGEEHQLRRARGTQREPEPGASHERAPSAGHKSPSPDKPRWARSIPKLTCTTSQERITAMMGFPLADVFLASASARPVGRAGRLGWHCPQTGDIRVCSTG